jgi:hypothetical protein
VLVFSGFFLVASYNQYNRDVQPGVNAAKKYRVRGPGRWIPLSNPGERFAQVRRPGAAG